MDVLFANAATLKVGFRRHYPLQNRKAMEREMSKSLNVFCPAGLIRRSRPIHSNPLAGRICGVRSYGSACHHQSVEGGGCINESGGCRDLHLLKCAWTEVFRLAYSR